MKTIAVTIFSVIVAITAFAHDDKYTEAMKKNIDAIYVADNIADLQQAVNAFERISAAEKTRWEPFYYASFGYIQMAMLEQEAARKDAFLDQAITALNKAREIAPNDSEVIALEGFIYMIRVTVDPATRGQQFVPMAMQSFGKSSAINPENPRALALMANMQYGTALFFGSPVTDACATLDKALDKFATFKSDNPLAPQWGKPMAEALKKQCQQK